MSTMQSATSEPEPNEGSTNGSKELCPSDCVCFSEDFCAALDGYFIPQYIIEPETFVVCYCNQALRNVIKKDIQGGLCYKELRNNDVPCEDCPAMRYYHQNDNTPKLTLSPMGFWLMIHASPIRWKGRDFIMMTCADIDRQKKLEEELELRNQEYSAVVQQSITGVMRYDVVSDVAAVNVDKNLRRVDEYSIPNFMQTIGKSGFVAADSMDEVRRLWEDVQNGASSQSYDVQLSLPRKGLRWCHIDYVPILGIHGEPYRAVFSFFDNTDQWEKEQAHKTWNNRLEALMNKYTAYMEVNLTQDLIVSEERSGAWHRDIGGRRFSDFVMFMCKMGIEKEDQPLFEKFFNHERLIGRFMMGQREANVEYRAIVDGAPMWFRAELLMVQDIETNDVMASILYSNVDMNKREKERLTRKAERDIMTGLYNHATAEDLIDKALDENTGERCCLLIIDLDDLRIINSDLGHPEGDRALRCIAKQLSEQFGEESILGRIGGDEFVALLRGIEGETELSAAVDGFLQGVSRCRIGAGNNRSIHVSVGGAVGLTGEHDFRKLYRQADVALFYTKAHGKNGFYLYNSEMENQKGSYKPRSSVSLTEFEHFEPMEIQRLFGAMAEFFPMILSANLTRNTYYMMEYRNYSSQHSKDQGAFDDLIQEGCESFHPEDRESFLRCFARENLLRAYEAGRYNIQYVGRQMGDDGVYRLVQAVAVMSKDKATGDICEITFTHVIPALDGIEGGEWVKRFPGLDLWERT